MEKNEISRKIAEDEDYIRCPKCNNSVNKFLMRNPDGAEDNLIARFLMMTEEKVREFYDEAVKFFQEHMADDEHDN
jgi:hypothetical protein